MASMLINYLLIKDPGFRLPIYVNFCVGLCENSISWLIAAFAIFAFERRQGQLHRHLRKARHSTEARTCPDRWCAKSTTKGRLYRLIFVPCAWMVNNGISFPADHKPYRDFTSCRCAQFILHSLKRKNIAKSLIAFSLVRTSKLVLTRACSKISKKSIYFPLLVTLRPLAPNSLSSSRLFLIASCEVPCSSFRSLLHLKPPGDRWNMGARW